MISKLHISAVGLVVALAAVYALWPADVLPPPPDGAVQVEVPSGQLVYYADVIQNAPGQGRAYRFRFIAPAIARDGGTFTFKEASVDMEYLCNEFALSHLSNIGPRPSQIIISLSDRPTPFGEANPEVTQFFEAYSIDTGACVWEPF